MRIPVKSQQIRAVYRLGSGPAKMSENREQSAASWVTTTAMKQADSMYKAMLARDYRFDGKFFVGVKTTGVYCRPVCPARPKRKNVEFFKRANDAEQAGYRPCLRCRPESAPASPAWIGKSAVVQRALRLVASGALLEVDEDQFAGRFGMSARHLRRLFATELGQTPKQIADTQRLNFARTLVVETALPMTEIAFNSGFASLRRFNEAFRNRFRRTPSQIRKSRRSRHPNEAIGLSLPYRPPFDWASLLAFFGSHSIPFVETVEHNSFERVFTVGPALGVIKVNASPEIPALQLQAHVSDFRCLNSLVRRVRAMFDLDSDPLLVANSLDNEPQLAKLRRRFPGLRIPGCWDGFETSVNAILGQVVSVSAGARLSRQLVEAYGTLATHPLTGAAIHLFPNAKTLAHANLAELRIPATKREAIRGLAIAVDSGQISLDESQDPGDFRTQLMAIRGIGLWTAQYISLRVLRDTDVFPASDWVLRKALARNRGIDVEATSPWRSYAALHLWKSEMQLEAKEHAA